MSEVLSFHFYENMLLAVQCYEPEKQFEILMAIIEYGLYKKEPENPALRALIQAFKPSVDKLRNRGGKRDGAGAPKWNKNAIKDNEINTNEQNNQIQQTETQPIVQNKFVSFTDNQEICDALNNPNSALSIFLDTGSRYDELTVDERNFVDRGDVRALCTWYKKTQAVETVVKKNFTPPTLEQVLEYARQQNSIAGVGGFACSDTDAEEFWSYYEAQSWRIGNESDTPIRDWKPKLRQWCVRNTKQKQPGNFMPRLSLKEMKQIQNEIELEKIRKGEK